MMIMILFLEQYNACMYNNYYPFISVLVADSQF